MGGRTVGPDFVEALARGLSVLVCFDAHHPRMTLSEIAAAAELARPTARRLLLTLQELGYVRMEDGSFTLTPQVLRFGVAYVSALGLWAIARPHMERLVASTGESTSMSQLDGSDIVYVSRVAVAKIITLQVAIGTRFPATRTSQGKVLLASLDESVLADVLALPSKAGLPPHATERTMEDVRAELRTVRARGWALADEELAPGIRSVAAPVRDGSGTVLAAINVAVHAAETSIDTLVSEHLPQLLRVAGDISADWALWQSVPQSEFTAERVATQ